MGSPAHRAAAAITAALALGGCVTLPTGPSVLALPGTDRSFEQFKVDDFECRQYAAGQSGVADANQVATESAVKSGAVGAAIGAVAGAVIGGRSGAGVGAGTGLIVGSAGGVGASQSSGYGAQRRYDNAYVQCMYAKGNRVPVSQQMGQSLERPRVAAPSGRYPGSPAPNYPPPNYPPPNYPPPR
ncbi:MAG: hypothetical protein IT514_01170 [Burkholderiales bacterium]|nr:hypothetical protein [Burkholderiales bacterium]